MEHIQRADAHDSYSLLILVSLFLEFRNLDELFLYIASGYFP